MPKQMPNAGFRVTNICGVQKAGDALRWEVILDLLLKRENAQAWSLRIF
jgi:hypothetical protein